MSLCEGEGNVAKSPFALSKENQQNMTLLQALALMNRITRFPLNP